MRKYVRINKNVCFKSTTEPEIEKSFKLPAESNKRFPAHIKGIPTGEKINESVRKMP